MATHSVLRRITQSTGIVMAGVLLSRILGFARDWTVAHQFGSNTTTDAYYAAFTLPDFLNYLVAGGSLSLIFIPVVAKYFAAHREDEAWHVFSAVITFMSLVLVALILIAIFFAPALVRVIVPGFPPAEKEHVVFLTRLMLPAQYCFYVGSILSAVQYAKERFIIPSLAPIVYNLGIILGGLLLSSRIGITGFSVGVLCGALVGNFLIQVYGARRVGARFRPNFDLRHPGFILFLKLAVPIMLALSLTFTDDWIMRRFASFLQPASITWLTYAKNLMRVPLGVVAQAVGVGSFPFLAQLYSEGKLEEMNRTLAATLKGLMLLLVPISALMMAESLPLVHFVYSHTRLRGPDFKATAAALVMFSLGLAAWGLQGIVARGYYATRTTLAPAIIGTGMTFLNLPVYWLLVRRLQHVGLALASTTGIAAYCVALFIGLNRRTKNRHANELVVFFGKITGASLGGALVAYRLTAWLGTRISWNSTHGAFVVLVIATTAGAALTLVFGKLLRIRELDAGLARLGLRRAPMPALPPS